MPLKFYQGLLSFLVPVNSQRLFLEGNSSIAKTLMCTAHRRYANCSHLLSIWSIRTYVSDAHFIDEDSDTQEGTVTCPWSYSWKRPGWDSHQVSLTPKPIILCIILWLGTTSHSLHILTSNASPVPSPLSSHLLLSQICLALCHLDLSTCHFPVLGFPSTFFPQGCTIALSPLNACCLFLLPTRHFHHI